jgi:hypothetical protein
MVHRCESNVPAPKWTPLPPGLVLINYDATIFESDGGMCIGVVTRNHLGSCLVACRQHVEGAVTRIWEGLALKHAVLMAIDEGFDKVIFVSDCLSLVQRLNSSTMHMSDIGILVDGIKLRMMDFLMVSVIHVKRQLNEAAHILAKTCLSSLSSELCIQFQVYPGNDLY